MLESRNIIWSEETFSLLDLLHSSHSLEYPLLVKLVQGHNGSRMKDNYAPDDTFVFYGWGQQERVLAENADKVLISIPTSHDHKLSVSFDDPEKSKHNVTLPLSSVVSIYAPPLRAEFDSSMTSIFSVGTTLYNSKYFGSMLLKSSHLLEYVKCSPISQGKVNMDALYALPTSSSLTCVMAKGLHNKDLSKALKYVQAEASFLMNTPVDDKLQDICGYSDLMPKKDGTYAYVEDIPAGPWGSRSGLKVSKWDPLAEHPPKNCPSRLPCPAETEPWVNTHFGSVPKPPPLIFKELSRVDITKEGDQLGVQPTTPKFKQPLAQTGSGYEKLQQKTVMSGPNNIGMMRGNFMKELEAKLNRTKSGTLVSENLFPMGLSYPSPEYTKLSHVHSPTPPSDPLQLPPTPKKQFIKPRMPDTTSTPNQDSAIAPISIMALGEPSPQFITPALDVTGRITNIEQVPEDVSSLSVQEVCDCLRLLKLDSHVQQFTDNLVDGRLLLTCTADDLQTEFGFSSFRARQVERFAKEGWRPKMNN